MFSSSEILGNAETFGEQPIKSLIGKLSNKRGNMTMEEKYEYKVISAKSGKSQEWATLNAGETHLIFQNRVARVVVK